MSHLKTASRELFRRTPDEVFASVPTLMAHCLERKEKASERWAPPRDLCAVPLEGALTLLGGDGAALSMTDWSFSQLCGLAKVNKETVNRLSPETAAKVFAETIPQRMKPVQLLAEGGRLRSLHGVGYTRLFSSEVLAVVAEFATDFGPPPAGLDGKTGLYAGEQDMFAFLIDPTGWAEIDGEAFAPGFFVWNSEVGKRSVGVSTFWFQAVCRNHIVWDATDVVEVTRTHTGQMGEALADVRTAIEQLVTKRDERRDGFVSVIRKAMTTKLGADADEVTKVLSKEGVGKALAKRALECADGRFTIFSVVDALTRLAGESVYAGDRLAADQVAAGLLRLAVAA